MKRDPLTYLKIAIIFRWCFCVALVLIAIFVFVVQPDPPNISITLNHWGAVLAVMLFLVFIGLL